MAEFLVSSRQLISQIIDAILGKTVEANLQLIIKIVVNNYHFSLGNQSPLSGVLYDSSTRKRAPTSYVAVFRTKDGSIPFSVTRNTPYWTHFLLLVANLVHYCKNQELYSLNKVPFIATFPCLTTHLAW